MKPTIRTMSRFKRFCLSFGILCGCALLLSFAAAAQTAPGTVVEAHPVPAKAATFATPEQAADALAKAARAFDVTRLSEIFGPDGEDIIFTGEPARDREMALEFAAKAHERMSVSSDPNNPDRAVLLIGKDNWPFPAPLVRKDKKWSFNTKAGRQEILYRRIGRNELDIIEICRGYVEAQHEYAFRKREGYDVPQYAQRIISTPGKQDGLAWHNPDGTWGGPVGETVAKAIEQGYTLNAEPYHGYFLKVLKGQGPAAPLGQMNYVIEGSMIGGFALVAAPAEYGITGVKTFMVSQDGVVYEKDLGPDTLDAFRQMKLFNPGKTWTPVREP